MATVESWFLGFAERLVQRLPRYDWYAPDSEYWAALRSRLVHHGVREAEADAASLLLMDAPPAHPDRVWPELLAAVLALRESRPGAAAPDDREAARAASRDCPYCAGHGLLAVVHPAGGDPGAHCPPTLGAVCVCPAGRWHKAAILRSLPPGRKAGMIDLAFVLDGRSAYRLPARDPDAPADPDAWSGAADALWETLPEAERETWRDLVRERLPELAGRPFWLEGLARGWAYDPSLVAGMPPPPKDSSWKRPRPRVPAVPPAPDVAGVPPAPAPPVAP